MVEEELLVPEDQDYRVLLLDLLFLEAEAAGEEARTIKVELLLAQLLEELTALDKTEHQHREHLILVEELVVRATTVME